MQSDLGKLFVGGISWDTNEERLKEYFNAYGEVVEAIIMKDRTTGRARGFGFVVFADPVVAERVIKEKHSIDGRMVEAKKAVPRDDQNVLSRNSGGSSIHGGSPGQGRTRKIFVGGLASTVTENEFKKYFEQFGSITDVVVMYDHNTQRPRGFGFITYDCEEAVDSVLVKTFHELNGKMVEVKRAVPKELSPGPTSRSPLGVGGSAYPPYSLNRVLNGAYNTPTPNGVGVGVGGFGVRMLDGRFSPIAPSNQQRGFQAFGSSYGGVGLNFDSVLSPGFGGNASFINSSNNINNISSNSVGYARETNPPYYIGSNSNRFDGGSIGFDEGSSSILGSRNLWGNININGGAPRYVPNSGSTNAIGYVGGSGGGSSMGGGGNGFGLNWDPSPIISPQSHPSYRGGGGGGDDTFSSDLLGGGAGRNNSGSLYADGTTFGGGGGGGGGGLGAGLYRSASTSSPSYVGDTTWRTSIGERDGGVFPVGFGLADFPPKNSPGYVGGYTISKRQSARDDMSFN